MVDTQKYKYNSGMDSKPAPANGNYLNIFNEILLDLNLLDLKQSLITNIGLIDICFEILDFCNGDYLQYPHHHKQKILGQFFSDQMLFGGEFVEWNMFLRNDLVLKSCIVLYYSCIHNVQNQQHIRSRMASNLKALFELFYQNMPYTVTKYFLALLQNVYCSNLSILIQIPQND